MTSIHDIIDEIHNRELDWKPGLKSLILKDNRGRRWFLATDMARMLRYSKYEAALKKHIKPEHYKRFGEIKDTIITPVPKKPFVSDDWRFLSEEGLYHFIVSSKRKQKAKDLKAKYIDNKPHE